MEFITRVGIDEKDSAPYRQWCVVYDYRTGAVIHTHEYIALSQKEACPLDELAEQAIEQAVCAIEQAPIDLGLDEEFLKVGYPSEDTPLEPDIRYYVDLKSGNVLWKKVPQLMIKPRRK